MLTISLYYISSLSDLTMFNLFGWPFIFQQRKIFLGCLFDQSRRKRNKLYDRTTKNKKKKGKKRRKAIIGLCKANENTRWNKTDISGGQLLPFFIIIRESLKESKSQFFCGNANDIDQIKIKRQKTKWKSKRNENQNFEN